MRKQRGLLFRWLAVAGVVCSLAAAGATASAATAGSTRSAAFCSTEKVHFAKTKFVFHAGLAFGAFHRWIWKPFRAGAFKSGAPHRLTTTAKAAAAALFAYHELSIACQDANNSDILRPLVHPLTSATSAFQAVAAKLKGGSFDDNDITSLNKAIEGIGTQSGKSGLPIADING